MPQPERSKESRQKVYAAIEAYMSAHPDIRLGQLLENVLYRSNDMYFIEDSVLAEDIRYYTQEAL
jgi:hypothetical protein